MSSAAQKGIILDPWTEENIRKRFDLHAPTEDVPESDEVTKIPGPEDAEVQEAREKERKLSRVRRGRASTILSRRNQSTNRTSLLGD